MKRQALLVLFALISLVSFGQESPSSVIRGAVVDAQSDFPLPGVTVLLIGSDPVVGTTTDIDGRFRLENIPVGRHGIQVSFIGYEPQVLSNLLVTSGKELTVNVKLSESVLQLDGAEIVAEDDKATPKNEMATVSARSFTVEEAMRYSGALQDPSRMAQNFAGVSNSSDDRNDIIIRGNSPSGVLWRMEGIDIPSPNHFSAFGSTGGPVSMLNINNLSNSDFLTSAFPSEYGNALAGVFDLELRNGNKENYEFLGQVGFNGFEFGAEGPIGLGKNGSFLINYRYSTLEVFNALGIEFGTGTAVPQYQDLTFKVDIPTAKAGRFGIFGVGGTSYIEFLASDATETNLFSSDAEDSRFGSNTGWVGVSHKYFFNERTSSKLVLAASHAGTDGNIDSLSTENGDPTRIFGLDRFQNKYTARLDINSKRNARNTIKFGVQADLNQFNFRDSVLYAPGEYFYESDFEDEASLVQSYISWQHRAGEKWTINAGLHSQHFLLNNSNAIEPRAGVRYKINDRQSLNLGMGLHSQMQPLPIYFNRERIDANTSVIRNDELDFNKSAHGVIGYDNLITNVFRIKVEAYYQYLYNVAVDRDSSSFSVLNAGAGFVIPNNADLVNDGTGFNYGLEFTAERFFNKGYYILGTASLFESKYEGSDGIERNTAFNTNYVLNLLGGKEFPLNEKSSISFDTKVTYAGGQRFTPIDFESSLAQTEEVLFEDQAFSEQYDPYFRWDFKITYRMNKKKTSQQFSIDLRNVTNQENVFMQQFNARAGEIETRYQIGFFPDVQYRIYF
ncbi:TonB-dependent receptor [Sanyastnella coralliicola]|uniref:TonB-dependent receptor n=1 Tax=Sanyastnella coralliicola TaxID=3069118 RepID=UPI0027BAB11D|nr:TonB-dependent receptor [Longitalea sp. SCSIO 12813]